MSVSVRLFALLMAVSAAACLGAPKDPGATQSSATTVDPDASCSHSQCATGTKLATSCSACVAEICKADSYCCKTRWSSQCVDEVASICDLSCSGSTTGGTSGGGGSTTTGGASGGTTGSGGGSDGTPTRQQCTGDFGTQLSSQHGRLDGYLVAILAPGASSKCNGDSSHVHLQVQMSGEIYDVAINVGSDVNYLEKTMTLPDGAWAEGWHTSDGLEYSSLGVSSSQFASTTTSSLTATLESELAAVNHISVFGTGYNANGMHLIHYQGGQSDGALALEPLSAQSRVLMFRFDSDSF